MREWFQKLIDWIVIGGWYALVFAAAVAATIIIGTLLIWITTGLDPLYP